MNAKSYMEGKYGNIPARGVEKNKAKQSQYAGRWPEILNTNL